MRVLHVCAYAAPYEGNFIRSLRHLERGLDGGAVYAFPESARDIPWCRSLAEERRVYFLPLLKSYIRPRTYSTLRRIYRECPDITAVHSHFELYDVPARLTAPEGVNVFWHLHDPIENDRSIKLRLLYKLQYGLLHGEARLISPSKKHGDYAIRLGFPENRVSCVHNCIDVSRIQRVSTPSDKRRFDFLMFGWDYTRKGVDLCVRAAKLLPGPLKIGVVGNEETARSIYAQFGRVEGVEVVAPVADINELYAQSKCFLHISRAEGFSYALLEAIYAGLPVICSDIPENLFAKAFPTVSIVKSEDPNRLALAMLRALNGCGYTDEQADASRSVIENEYSLSAWSNRILSCYGADAR